MISLHLQNVFYWECSYNMIQQHKDELTCFLVGGTGRRSSVLFIDVESTDKTSWTEILLSSLLKFKIISTISDVFSIEIIRTFSLNDWTGKICSEPVAQSVFDGEIFCSETWVPVVAISRSRTSTSDAFSSENLIDATRIQMNWIKSLST